MSTKITKSDLLEELSAEQQQLLAGGQSFVIDMGQMGEMDDSADSPVCPQSNGAVDGTDSEGRVRSIPIRFTGNLEVFK